MNKTKLVGAYLPPDKAEELRELAWRERKTVADKIREGIDLVMAKGAEQEPKKRKAR